MLTTPSPVRPGQLAPIAAGDVSYLEPVAQPQYADATSSGYPGMYGTIADTSMYDVAGGQPEYTDVAPPDTTHTYDVAAGDPMYDTAAADGEAMYDQASEESWQLGRVNTVHLSPPRKHAPCPHAARAWLGEDPGGRCSSRPVLPSLQ